MPVDKSRYGQKMSPRFWALSVIKVYGDLYKPTSLEEKKIILKDSRDKCWRKSFVNTAHLFKYT